MIPIHIIFVIHLAHYIADFCLQTHWQASNKSKSNYALACHVGTYTAVLILTGICILGMGGVLWAILNGVIHFAVDYFTSRQTSKEFNKDWHKFFEIVGLDQLIHFTTLFTTYIIFNG